MLTPLDIEGKNFKKTIYGFASQEVKTFLADILKDYEKIYKENIELKDKVKLLNEGIQYYKTIEGTLQNTLLLAEKTAEETKANAHKRAAIIEKDADLKSHVLLENARNEVYRVNKKKEELIQQYDAAKIQIRQFLKAQIELTTTNSLEIRQETITIEDIMDQKTAEEVAVTQDANV